MAISNALGVIEFFLHPPLALQQLEPIAGGPFTGLRAFTRARGPVNVDAFGIRYNVVTFPPGYGVTPSAGGNLFDRPVVDIAITHALLTGTLITSQSIQLRTASAYVLFNESFPWIVNLEMAPGIAVDAWWMLAF